jgi:hypothetical protein
LIGLAVRKFRDAFLHLLALVTSTGTTGMEFQSSTTLLVCSAFMFYPGTNLSSFIPYQRELLSLAPESTWAIAFLVVGLAQAFASFQRVSRVRMISAFFAASVFGSLAVAAAMASPVSFFVLAFAGVAGLSQGICFLVMSLARSRVGLFPSGASLPKVRLDGNA